MCISHDILENGRKDSHPAPIKSEKVVHGFTQETYEDGSVLALHEDGTPFCSVPPKK